MAAFLFTPTPERELDTPDDALRVQHQLYTERIQRQLQEEREVSGLIQDAWRASWTEFYAHEQGQCPQLLQSLAVALPCAPHSGDGVPFVPSESDDFDMITEDYSGTSYIIHSSDTGQVTMMNVNDTIVLPNVTPYAYPKYESCTPSPEVIRYSGDPRVLQFVPYADGSGFDVETYAAKHVRFAWQTDLQDVDFKLIAADALLRLEDAELDIELVERYKPWYCPSPKGNFLSFLNKRDLCGWGAESLQARQTRPPASSSLISEVNNMLANFCSSLNCNAAKCSIHEYISESIPNLQDDTGVNLDAAQGMINKFRGLNYFFDSPSGLDILDAATVGNTLRYINDPMDPAKQNVRAESKYVSGEAKILLFASTSRRIECGHWISY
ncbi:hypothetical protein C8Q77DRAFT_1054780 [Trametes polyzona]|nr:hypothetical protein C8Q77DRAFT_1054780 [Trametes polyzona]